MSWLVWLGLVFTVFGWSVLETIHDKTYSDVLYGLICLAIGIVLLIVGVIQST